MYVLVPEIGAEAYFTSSVLRGLFDTKNQAGRIAGFSLVILVALRRDISLPLKLIGLVACGLCLVLANSKTAIVAAVLASAYVFYVSVLSRHVSRGLGVLSLGFAGVVVIAVVAVLLRCWPT